MLNNNNVHHENIFWLILHQTRSIKFSNRKSTQNFFDFHTIKSKVLSSYRRHWFETFFFFHKKPTYTSIQSGPQTNGQKLSDLFETMKTSTCSISPLSFTPTHLPCCWQWPTQRLPCQTLVDRNWLSENVQIIKPDPGEQHRKSLIDIDKLMFVSSL